MHLRPARPADEAAIVALTARLADFPLPPTRTAREIQVADHPMLLSQLADPRDDVLFLVADDAGSLVGAVFANTRTDYFTHSRHAYVEVLAVAEAAAGRGIARALMEAVEEWARAKRYGKVELSVFAANQRARGLYEHLGYDAEIMRYARRID